MRLRPGRLIEARVRREGAGSKGDISGRESHSIRRITNGGIPMAKAYWIATYREIKDPAALEAYAKLAGPALWSAGGRNLVRGMPAKTLEAGLNMRTVVIEFESVAAALAAYESPAY
jgi:uncharacterized protein (DUF1330 family)